MRWRELMGALAAGGRQRVPQREGGRHALVRVSVRARVRARVRVRVRANPNPNPNPYPNPDLLIGLMDALHGGVRGGAVRREAGWRARHRRRQLQSAQRRCVREL